MTGGAGLFDGLPIEPVEKTTINWKKSAGKTRNLSAVVFCKTIPIIAEPGRFGSIFK